jgi:electron transfer flavoprotein beta subunit
VRILVCVKFVPDPTDDVEFTPALTLARPEGTGLLSELDEYAVEQALVLAEQFPGATVTALTVGPEAAEIALRKALQMGADEAVLVSDPAIAGSDVFGTATVLAAAVALVGPDLVVCGMSSTDSAGGVLPALLSSRLGWPLLSLAATVVPAGPGLRITRTDEVGLRTAEAALPAVISVTDQSGEPRYPSFKDVLGAKKKTVGVISLADLGVAPTEVGAAAARVTVTGVVRNPERAAGRVLVDDGGSSVPELVDFLMTATR